VTELFLKLLGVPAGKASAVSRMSLDLRGELGIGLAILAAIALGVAVYYLYRRSAEGLSRARRISLTTLRIAFLVLLVALLLRPVLALTIEGSIRRSLVLLVDSSASMQIKDPRTNPDDLKRAAIATGLLDPARGMSQTVPRHAVADIEQIERIELVRAALQNPQLNLLRALDRNFDVRFYSFGDSVQEMERAPAILTEDATAAETLADHAAWLRRLDANAPATAIGEAVRDVLNRMRGQPLAGIVLVTDGANNSGLPPLEAALLARQEGVPLWTWGVGMTSPKDIMVQTVFAQDTVFLKDEVPVQVRFRGRGVTGHTTRMIVTLGGQKLEERDITFTDESEQVIDLHVTPQQKGEVELKISIPPLEDEAVKDNNELTHHFRVVDDTIKLLYVEQYPRHEFKFLQATLLRDRRIEARFILFEADPALAHEEGSPYLREFPSQKDDLFAYDVVILGDVDPRNVPLAQLEALTEFVSRYGGALIVLAGRRYNPWTWRHSAFEKLLPVELDPSLAVTAEPMASKPLHLELTAAGQTSPMLRLADQELENIARWKALPPIYWVARVARAKPAAEVLLVDPDPLKASRFEKMPVIAVHQYGLGQVLWVGTDNIWRWRRNTGDRYYSMIWGQIVQRMALQRVLGAAKRTQLTSDRQTYMTGDRVTIYARLYTPNYDPVVEPSVKGFFEPRGAETLPGPPGGEREVLLRPIPQQPGMYRGELIAPGPGAWRFYVERDRETDLEFVVTEPRFEFGDTAMNDALLRELAAITGGRFFREEDLHGLPSALAEFVRTKPAREIAPPPGGSTRTAIRSADRIVSTYEVEVWSTPLYFLLLLGIVTAEWILRKLSHLK
jgi:hypothetical protein